MTKCLITGGAGFIGSHLVEACLEKGFEVLVIDDLSTGRTDNLPLDHPHLDFFRGDIRDRALLEDIGSSNSDIDYIFHLAAIASVIRSTTSCRGFSFSLSQFTGLLLLPASIISISLGIPSRLCLRATSSLGVTMLPLTRLINLSRSAVFSRREAV